MVLVAGLVACGKEATRERRNVLLVTLDTTRFNAVGFMGNPAKPTPRLDEFAKDAVVYEMARTVTPLTMPARILGRMTWRRVWKPVLPMVRAARV